MYEEAGHGASVTESEHLLFRSEAEAGFKDHKVLVGIHLDHGAGGADKDIGFRVLGSKDRAGGDEERTPPHEDQKEDRS